MSIHRLGIRTHLVLLVLTVGLALIACAPAPSQNRPAPDQAAERPAAAPQRPLVIAIRGELPTVAARPLTPFSGALYPPLNLFNAALNYRDELEVPRPYLAALPELNTDTWRVLPDGRMETAYRLLPGLTWHDGAALSASDFVFGWRVYGSPQFGAAGSPPISLMEEVLAPDERTVVVRWRQPYPDAAVMADGWVVGFQPLPRHLLQEPFRDLDPVAFTSLPFWTTEYVGLGPYRIETWEPGTFIGARAFDGHVLGRPRIDRIEVRFIPDPQTAVANLLAGSVHYVSDYILSVTEGQTLEEQFPQRGGGTVLYSPVSLRKSVFQFRPEYVEHPALQDVRVRRAVASGIDAALAVEVLTAGKGIRTHTYLSPKVPYYAEIERVIQKYDYDPRRVEQLMTEAGFAKGSDGFFAGRDGQTVQLTLSSSAGSKNESEAATYVDGLRRAGLAVTQRVLPAALVADPEQRAIQPGMQVRGASGAAEYLVYTSEQNSSPANRWRGDNRGGWSNAAYDRWFETFTTSLASADRINSMAQLEKILTEEVPVVFHHFGVEVNGHVAGLHGPVARPAPNTSGAFLYVHTWEWRS